MSEHKYKIGDKFVLEVANVLTFGDGTIFYEFHGLVPWLTEKDVDGLGQLVQGVDQYSRTLGQQEAWDLAQRIVKEIDDGGYAPNELQEIFDNPSHCVAIEVNTYAEAAAKVEAWEQGKEIRVGDVVETDDGYIGIVTDVSMNYVDGIRSNGVAFSFSKKGCTKTGRHIDIGALLAEIGGEK